MRVIAQFVARGKTRTISVDQRGATATESRFRIPARLKFCVQCSLVTLILVGITAVRLAPTYTTFSGTYDEPLHIAAGMEWLDKGTYTYNWEAPPVARIATAIGPYLRGRRSKGMLRPSLMDLTDEGNEILQSDGKYRQNLMWARFGNLPFLVLACVAILLWARRWFTQITGVWALVLFLSLPPILGHATLATLDMACTATLVAALYHLMRWLEDPVWRRSLWLGTALGFALLTKFSNLVFIAVCFASLFAYLVLRASDRRKAYRQVKVRVGQACVTVCITLLVLWAGYRFSVVPISSVLRTRSTLDRLVAERPSIRGAADQFLNFPPFPLAQFAGGVMLVQLHDMLGHDSYLLGHYRRTGWWYFFPVVLGVKTPLGFLILAFTGLSFVLLVGKSHPWQHIATALFPIVIFLFCMTSRIDLGIRHILPIYPMLSLMAGHAIQSLFQNRTWRNMQAVAILLVCAVLADSWRAHPDYLAYFNQLRGNHPENVLAESDLDWGQDLHRLSLRLKALGIKELSVSYFGTAPLEDAGLPNYRILLPDEKPTGYVAISVRNTTLEYAKNGAYGWSKQYTPLERIGKSIFLYCVECPLDENKKLP